MHNKGSNIVSEVYFEKQTLEALVKNEKPDPLYEKAFLSGEDKSKTEYAQNTTTWD